MPPRSPGRAAPLALVAAITLAAGCAGAFSCPIHADDGWRELATRNFVLRTDLPADRARAALDDLERLRAALLTSFRARPDLPTGQIPVVVLDRGWGAVAGPLFDGLFAENVLFQPLLAMRAGSRVGRQTTVVHELVHHLSFHVAPRQPPWLAEGLAQYFETLEVSDDGRWVIVGRPAEQNVRYAQRVGLRAVAEMRAGTDVHAGGDGFYPTAWLMVHHLMNHRPEALATYQRALQRTAREEEAFREAFGPLTSEALDRELRRYLDGGRYSVFHFPFRQPPVRVLSERTLAPADAHASRGLLYATIREGAEDMRDRLPSSREELDSCARREVAEALSRAPDHVLGLAVQHWALGVPVEAARAERAARGAPEDWLAWWLVAASLEARGEGDPRFSDAVDRAQRLAAGNPAVKLKVVRRAPQPERERQAP
jgi:hypothetical protein